MPHRPRGLGMVAALSRSWGCRADPGWQVSMWCEIPDPHGASGGRDWCASSTWTPFSVPTRVMVASALSMAAGTYAQVVSGSSGPTAAKLPGSNQPKLSPRRPLPPPSCGSSPASASRSRPPMPSPAPCSAPEPPNEPSGFRRGVAGNIVLAWLITLPCAGLVGAGVERLTRLQAGDGIAVGLAAVIGSVAIDASSGELAWSRPDAGSPCSAGSDRTSPASRRGIGR